MNNHSIFSCCLFESIMHHTGTFTKFVSTSNDLQALGISKFYSIPSCLSLTAAYSENKCSNVRTVQMIRYPSTSLRVCANLALCKAWTICDFMAILTVLTYWF